RLNTARSSHSTATAGNFVYVTGGYASGGALHTLERAPLNADGTLRAFVMLPPTLVTARGNHISFITSPNRLCLAGGYNGTYLASVECATVNNLDTGALNPFAILPYCCSPPATVVLSAQRAFLSSAVTDNNILLVGGAGGSPLNNVDSAGA